MQKIALRHKPVGARKMSDDESEMFFVEYWQFNAELGDMDVSSTWERARSKLRSLDPRQAEEDVLGLQNASVPHLLDAPFALHTERQLINIPILRRLSRASSDFGERNLQCPTGTSSCVSIDRPNSCCPSEQTCQLVTDTGKGDVGCCAQGQACSQQVSDCKQGYPSCPDNQGGGCCIPGHVCVGVGCKFTCPPPQTIIANIKRCSECYSHCDH